MTPNFALSLSFEGIALLRRMGARWARIDEVALDHAEFDSQVIALRDRAEALDPTGAQVALIIPNEQIRYLDQPDHGGDEIARDEAIRTALDGATPYAVSELTFDYVVSGGQMQVAAVAQETLEEAESFAQQHGFEPVCFLAKPEDGNFDGAVFFGKTASWGRAVARPSRAIEIVDADKAALKPLPKADLFDTPAPTPGTAPAPVAAAPPEPEPVEAEPEPVEAEPVEAEPVKKAAPVAEPPAEAPAAIAPAKTPEPAAPVEKDDFAPLPEEKPSQTPPAPRPEPVAESPKPAPLAATSEDEAKPVAFSTRRASRDAQAEQAPPVTSNLRARFTPVPQVDNDRAEPVEPPASEKTGFFATPSATALLAQAAAAADAAEAKGTAPPAAARPKPAAPKQAELPPRPKPKQPELPPRLKAKAKSKATAKPGPKPLPKVAATRPAGLPPPPKPGAAIPVAARTTDAAPTAKTPRAPHPNPLAKLAALRGPQRDKVAAAPAPSKGGGAGTAVATPSGAMFGASDERAQMTVFGARARGETGGKPRYLGLLLTALLLLFLAGVAAWASVFMEDGLARLFRSGDEPAASAVASLPDPGDADVVVDSTAPAASASPEISLRPVARPNDDLRLAVFESSDVTVDAPLPPLSVPLDPAQLTPEEAAATYAATGIWQRAPVEPRTPPTDGVDDIYAASIDPDIQIFDAVALPDAKELEREAALADPGLPPPAGLTFDFNDRDVVRATPEGALTPDGLRIFTGRPPVIPPLRGENTTAEPVPGTPDAVETVPRLRPKARPGDIIEQRERSQLRGITRNELASIRPTMRPKTVQEQAEVDAPDATDQAVTRSLVPVGRPRDMATIVDRADRSIAPTPVQTAAAVAPRTVAPKIPSSASVARSATVQNAINLKKINLIGVYGTSDNRRALVRLPNGKFQKVKVGDRLDGGRVTAIGDENLRYTKGNRNLTLEMPRS